MPTEAPTNQQFVQMCDRAMAALLELKSHAVQLAQFAQEIKTAEHTLVGLKAQVAQATPLAAQIEELQQRIKVKHAELSELDVQIQRKSEQHGKLDAELGSIVKRVTSWRKDVA